MNLSFENHTPQSLRDSSSILEEQLDTKQIIFIELTLTTISLNQRNLQHKHRKS